MKLKKGILFFGLTEIAIGTITLAAIFESLLRHVSTKPLNILIFVIISGIISASLGTGILLRIRYTRKLLMFFAGWIILSKILIFGKIIMLNGSLETTVSPNLKNTVSIIYHFILIFYFHHPSIKAELEQ